MTWEVKIDAGKCNGDGNCKDACPVDVYEIQGGKAVAVNADECIGCESCVEACELDAIVISES